MTVSEGFSDFIYSRRLKGLKGKTIEDYDMHLRRFIRYVGADTALPDLTKELIDGYVLAINDSDLGKGTKHSYIRDARIFLMFLASEYGLPFDPSVIHVPKNPKKTIRIYTEDEMQKIINATICDTHWITMRNRAIILLMYDSGLRQNEVCTLLASNIQWDKKRLKVFGKGDKERFVPFGDVTCKLMLRYEELCPYDIEDTFFVHDKGGAMSRNTIKMFIQYMKRKLPFEFSSHRLRHNFATNWLVDFHHEHNFFDTTTLQYLMGHESQETTKLYIHSALGELASETHNSHADKLNLDL